MIDDQMLIEAFRKTATAHEVRVPPLARIVALAEYAREMERRRRFTISIAVASALAAACAFVVILFAPGPFPLSLSPGILPLVVLGAIETFWVAGAVEDSRGPRRNAR